MMTEYVNDLRQMAKILKHEGRSIDELKVLILGFYIKLNCGETIPAIDRELVSSIRKAAAAAGASKYDVEELLLSTIHEDTAPRRNFTPRDSLYVLEHERRLGTSGVDCSQIQSGSVIPLTIWQKVVRCRGGKHKG